MAGYWPWGVIYMALITRLAEVVGGIWYFVEFLWAQGQNRGLLREKWPIEIKRFCSESVSDKHINLKDDYSQLLSDGTESLEAIITHKPLFNNNGLIYWIHLQELGLLRSQQASTAAFPLFTTCNITETQQRWTTGKPDNHKNSTEHENKIYIVLALYKKYFSSTVSMT